MFANHPRNTVGRCNAGDKVQLTNNKDVRVFEVGGQSSLRGFGDYVELHYKGAVAVVAAQSCLITVVEKATVLDNEADSC